MGDEPNPPVQATVFEASGVRPASGTIVGVPLAPATGAPGANVVAVEAKEWWKSSTIWIGLAGLAGSIGDATVTVILPAISTGQSVKWADLGPKFLVAVFSGYIAWRRKQDNSVIS
jgi:hypothetical protein